MDKKYPLDKKGIEILPGDLVKVFHFIGPRNKKYFMYKIIHEVDGHLAAAHVHRIYIEGLQWKNSYSLELYRGKQLESYEIIEGYNGLRFDERPKYPYGEARNEKK